MFNKKTFALVIIFSLITAVFTYPLIFHLDYIFHSYIIVDAPKFIFYLYHFKESIRNRVFPLPIRKNFFPDGTDPLHDTIPVVHLFLGGGLLNIIKTSPEVIHNLLLFFYIVLSGISMYFLSYEYTNDIFSAFISGFVYSTSNYILFKAVQGQMNLVQLFYIPMIFLLTEKVFKHHNPKNIFILGVLLGLQFLESQEYFLYLMFFLPLYIICSFIVRKDDLGPIEDLSSLFKMGIIIGVGFLLIAGWFLTYFIDVLRNDIGIERDLEEIKSEALFNDLSSLINLSNPIINPLLVLLSLATFFIKISRTKWLVPYFLIGMIGFVASLGPFSKYSPYYLLYSYFPFFIYFRTPYRLNIILILFTSLSVGKVFVLLKSSKSKSIIILMIILLSLYFKPDFFSGYIKYNKDLIQKYERLKSKEEISVVEYPIIENYWYSYNIMYHKNNLIGGSGSTEPKRYMEFKEVCGIFDLNLGDDNCRNLVKKYNVTYLIFNEILYPVRFPKIKEIEKIHFANSNLIIETVETF